MYKNKKWIAIALATTVLGGCGVQEQENAVVPVETFEECKEQQVKYVERTTDMPYVEGAEDLLSFDKDKEGNLHFFSVDENFLYHDYETNPLLGDTLSYEEKEISWLHTLVPDYNSWIIDMRMDTQGCPVACVVNEDGQWMVAKEGTQISIEDCPGGIAVTEDNQIVLPYDRTGIVTDWEGKDVYSFEKGMAPSTVSQAADVYKTYIACKNTQEDAVVVYDYVQKNKIAEIPYTFNKDEDIVIRFDNQNSIYIADRQGIHQAKLTDMSFTTLVDGKNATIGINSCGIVGMEIDNSGNIWCAVQDYTTGKTQICCYSKVKLEKAAKKITLYTMKESDWLKKVVINFQNRYPQYTVQMIVDNDKTTTVQDKLRNLHAQLLSGSGPDILMLDGLPVDSYVDKGFLSDISECVENSDMIEGVKNSITTENGVYAVATRMGIPVMLDQKGEADMMASTENLKQALQENEFVISPMEADALAEVLAVVYYDELFNGDNTFAEEGLNNLVDVMCLMSEKGFVTEPDEYAQKMLEEHGARFGLTCLPAFRWNSCMAYNLAVGEANVALQECNRISIEVLGIASHLDKNMSVMKNMYFPYGQLGVNSGSQSREAAKQFVTFALSQEEQSIYVEDGIPVTNAGLEALKKVNNSTSSMGMCLADGSELQLSWPTETEISNFVELCKKVDKKQQIEQVIVQMLKTESQKYLTGEVSEDEIRKTITNQIKTYLEEQK